MVNLTVLGISMQEEDGVPLILLHPQGTERVLVMRIGPMEALSISTALHESASQLPDHMARKKPDSLFPRPQTHDLLANVISALGGSMHAVDILHHVDDAFIAEVVITHPNGTARVDCRPSDGIALALRCGAAIRASSAVLAHAGDMAAVMAGLPEHVRTIAALKLAQLTQPGKGIADKLPPILENALAMRKNTTETTRQNLISVAQKMLEDEHFPLQRSKTPAPAQPAPAPPKFGIATPQIRVSLVRQKKGGEAEIVNEYHIPAAGLPKEVVASLGLSGKDAAALSAATDEERWAILLNMLAPETKVRM